MNKQTIITQSAAETFEFGKNFAQRLKGRETVALIGKLGSGKTTFVQGVAAGLGLKEKITSPTFVLLKEHKIKIPNSLALPAGRHFLISKLIHIDCYRIKSTVDVESIGIFDYLGQENTVCLIEWADKIKKILPKKRIEIYFEHKGGSRRKIWIKFPISNP